MTLRRLLFGMVIGVTVGAQCSGTRADVPAHTAARGRRHHGGGGGSSGGLGAGRPRAGCQPVAGDPRRGDPVGTTPDLHRNPARRGHGVPSWFWWVPRAVVSAPCYSCWPDSNCRVKGPCRWQAACPHRAPPPGWCSSSPACFRGVPRAATSSSRSSTQRCPANPGRSAATNCSPESGWRATRIAASGRSAVASSSEWRSPCARRGDSAVSPGRAVRGARRAHP